MYVSNRTYSFRCQSGSKGNFQVMQRMRCRSLSLSLSLFFMYSEKREFVLHITYLHWSVLFRIWLEYFVNGYIGQHVEHVENHIVFGNGLIFKRLKLVIMHCFMLCEESIWWACTVARFIHTACWCVDIFFQRSWNRAIGKGGGTTNLRTTVLVGRISKTTFNPMWGPHGAWTGTMLKYGKTTADTTQ